MSAGSRAAVDRADSATRAPTPGGPMSAGAGLRRGSALSRGGRPGLVAAALIWLAFIVFPLVDAVTNRGPTPVTCWPSPAPPCSWPATCGWCFTPSGPSEPVTETVARCAGA